MKGSGAKPYILKNVGGVYSCSCPAWRNQSTAIERRTCKHLRKLRGEEAEADPVGLDPAPKAANPQRDRGGKSPKPRQGRRSCSPRSGTTAEDLGGWWLSEKLDGVRAY